MVKKALNKRKKGKKSLFCSNMDLEMKKRYEKQQSEACSVCYTDVDCGEGEEDTIDAFKMLI